MKLKKFAALVTVLAVVTLLAVLFAMPAHAEEPETAPPVDADGFIELPSDFVPPPLPPIPTLAEYEAGWKTPQHTTPDDGDTAADSGGDCLEQQELTLTYWTKAIPSEQGGGTAEGYAGFYAGRTEECYNWIQPVTGTRVTYGGQIDNCWVKGRSKRVWPDSDRIFWTATDEIEPCGVTPARVISRARGAVPGHKYGVWGDHRFRNGDGADLWQIFGDTYTVYWITW